MLIGMVHLLPLPGSPFYNKDLNAIEKRAWQDVKNIEKAGFDAIIIENYGDQPFLINEVPLESLISMAKIVSRITKKTKLKIGINIEFNAWKEELIMAKVMEADFIRVEVFNEFRFHESGLVFPSIAKILRARKSLNAESVKIFVDINVKNTFPIIKYDEKKILYTIDKYADAIIYTGSETGKPPKINDIKKLKENIHKPLYIGSGVNEKNIIEFLNIAEGVIVGTAIKEGNKTENPVSFEKAQKLVKLVKQKL